MLVQVGLECEGLHALGTLKVFCRRVGLHVRAEVGPVGKALLADGAQVGLLSCVGPQVALKQPRPRESLPTDVALVVEVVGEDVHGESRHGDVHLAADVALLSAAGIQTPVGLLVPRQV